MKYLQTKTIKHYKKINNYITSYKYLYNNYNYVYKTFLARGKNNKINILRIIIK